MLSQVRFVSGNCLIIKQRISKCNSITDKQLHWQFFEQTFRAVTSDVKTGPEWLGVCPWRRISHCRWKGCCPLTKVSTFLAFFPSFSTLKKGYVFLTTLKCFLDVQTCSVLLVVFSFIHPNSETTLVHFALVFSRGADWIPVSLNFRKVQIQFRNFSGSELCYLTVDPY